MARLRMLFRCIGEAVCAKGMKALLSVVPFGEALYDIAEDAWQRLKRSAREEEQLAAVAAAARASVEEARREALAAVGEITATTPLPDGLDMKLVCYLTQVASTVKQSLKRPADPAGQTVPPTFTLKQAEQLLPLLPARMPRFNAGDRPAVGNWELQELLGAGGFGEVWKARHPSLAGIAPVALKFCLDPSASSYLRHEAALLDRVMRQSSHPGIVPLRQAYLDTDPVCLEYEYVNGGDLAGVVNEWTRSGKVPRRQVNRLVQRLAEIVGHAHALTPPIVHRDLKPANILIERTPDQKVRLRVADFGIGAVAAQRTLGATRRGATARGDLLATSLRGAHTPIYASPQQQRGEPADVRDDVHALGVIWYQLLVGDLAGGVPADWTVVLAERGQPRPLIDLLGACLASRSDKRLASAAVLAERLDKALNADIVLDAVAVAEVLPAVRPATVRPAPAALNRPEPAEVMEVLPADPPPRTVRRNPIAATTPTSQTPPPPARSGNQVCRYTAPTLRLPELIADLQNWLIAQDFNVQCLSAEGGATLLQIDQQSTWRQLAGMSTALNVILKHDGGELIVEIGAGRWVDKATAGVVSLFVLWPLAVTVAIGAWNQMKMPERVFTRISEYLDRRRSDPSAASSPAALAPPGVSADAIARLRELASLRDQGILTNAEFQAEKAKLLG